MITFRNSISVEDYNMLRKSVGWNELDYEQASIGLKNTSYAVSVVEDGNTIAMGRLITDGGYVALIVDVVVLPGYQHRGFGSAIVENILNFIQCSMKQGQVVYIHLMASQGKEPFYEKFGFARRPQGFMGSGMSMRMSKSL